MTVTREHAIAAVRQACVKAYGADMKSVVVHTATKFSPVDPFGAAWRIEVTYDPIHGWRAVYGVKPDGKTMCYMD